VLILGTIFGRFEALLWGHPSLLGVFVEICGISKPDESICVFSSDSSKDVSMLPGTVLVAGAERKLQASRVFSWI